MGEVVPFRRPERMTVERRQKIFLLAAEHAIAAENYRVLADEEERKRQELLAQIGMGKFAPSNNYGERGDSY